MQAKLKALSSYENFKLRRLTIIQNPVISFS